MVILMLNGDLLVTVMVIVMGDRWGLSVLAGDI
jgi:hypothetical protein